LIPVARIYREEPSVAAVHGLVGSRVVRHYLRLFADRLHLVIRKILHSRSPNGKNQNPPLSLLGGPFRAELV